MKGRKEEGKSTKNEKNCYTLPGTYPLRSYPMLEGNIMLFKIPIPGGTEAKILESNERGKVGSQLYWKLQTPFESSKGRFWDAYQGLEWDKGCFHFESAQRINFTLILQENSPDIFRTVVEKLPNNYISKMNEDATISIPTSCWGCSAPILFLCCYIWVAVTL